MSGTEANLVLGLISSVIAIIEASQKTYEAARNAQGLHEAFRKVAANIPLVLDTLREAERVQETAVKHLETKDATQQQAIAKTSIAVKPVIEACKQNAQALQKIFEAVLPSDGASWLERYRKALKTVLPGKERKVEELMEEILEKLQLLHTNGFFKASAKMDELKAALEDLASVSPSLPDEDGTGYMHSGSGSLNVNTGTGVQKNFTQSGGSGQMINTDSISTLNLGR